MSEITYGQIFQKFRAQFPDIEVSDYRPASLPYTIHVWTKDKRCLLYLYEVVFQTGFIVGETVQDEREKSELKPCPFCGQAAYMKTRKHVPDGVEFTPQCADPSCCGRLTKIWLNRQQAIDAWNKRKM